MDVGSLVPQALRLLCLYLDYSLNVSLEPLLTVRMAALAQSHMTPGLIFELLFELTSVPSDHPQRHSACVNQAFTIEKGGETLTQHIACGRTEVLQLTSKCVTVPNCHMQQLTMKLCKLTDVPNCHHLLAVSIQSSKSPVLIFLSDTPELNSLVPIFNVNLYKAKMLKLYLIENENFTEWRDISLNRSFLTAYSCAL